MADSEPLIAARNSSSDYSDNQHEALLGQNQSGEYSDEDIVATVTDRDQDKRKGLFAYLHTKDFWTILLLG